MRRHRTVTLGVAVLLAVPALVLAACGGDDGEATPTTTVTTTTTAETTTTTTPEEVVLAAYRAFWDAYLEAADPVNPEHPVLAEVATGEELDQLRNAFLARLTAGEVIRGEVELAPRITEVDGTAATVTDCYLDRTGIYDAATGERKDTESGLRHLVTVDLVLEGTSWKVEHLAREGDGCTPVAAS